MSSFQWCVNHISILNECWVMASQRPPTFSEVFHGTSNHLNWLCTICSLHGRRGMLKGLDVNLSTLDRNFQNNNWFHLEISLRILNMFYFYGISVSAFKWHISLLSLKNVGPDSAKLIPSALAGACILREIYTRGFPTWGAMQWTWISKTPVACCFVLITE